MTAALAPSLPREERLRTTAGLRGTPALVLSAWRGLSGSRYVVAILPLAAAEFDDLGPAVVLAVYRDPLGHSRIVHASATDGLDVPAFMARADQGSATELHAHRLEVSADGRAAVVADLTRHQEMLS